MLPAGSHAECGANGIHLRDFILDLPKVNIFCIGKTVPYKNQKRQ
jgi:hypothetical protein